MAYKTKYVIMNYILEKGVMKNLKNNIILTTGIGATLSASAISAIAFSNNSTSEINNFIKDGDKFNANFHVPNTFKVGDKTKYEDLKKISNSMLDVDPSFVNPEFSIKSVNGGRIDVVIHTADFLVSDITFSIIGFVSEAQIEINNAKHIIPTYNDEVNHPAATTILDSSITNDKFTVVAPTNSKFNKYIYIIDKIDKKENGFVDIHVSIHFKDKNIVATPVTYISKNVVQFVSKKQNDITTNIQSAFAEFNGNTFNAKDGKTNTKNVGDTISKQEFINMIKESPSESFMKLNPNFTISASSPTQLEINFSLIYGGEASSTGTFIITGFVDQAVLDLNNLNNDKGKISAVISAATIPTYISENSKPMATTTVSPITIGDFIVSNNDVDVNSYIKDIDKDATTGIVTITVGVKMVDPTSKAPEQTYTKTFNFMTKADYDLKIKTEEAKKAVQDDIAKFEDLTVTTKSARVADGSINEIDINNLPGISKQIPVAVNVNREYAVVTNTILGVATVTVTVKSNEVDSKMQPLYSGVATFSISGFITVAQATRDISIIWSSSLAHLKHLIATVNTLPATFTYNHRNKDAVITATDTHGPTIPGSDALIKSDTISIKADIATLTEFIQKHKEAKLVEDKQTLLDDMFKISLHTVANVNALSSSIKTYVNDGFVKHESAFLFSIPNTLNGMTVKALSDYHEYIQEANNIITASTAVNTLKELEAAKAKIIKIQEVTDFIWTELNKNYLKALVSVMPAKETLNADYNSGAILPSIDVDAAITRFNVLRKSINDQSIWATNTEADIVTIKDEIVKLIDKIASYNKAIIISNKDAELKYIHDAIIPVVPTNAISDPEFKSISVADKNIINTSLISYNTIKVDIDAIKAWANSFGTTLQTKADADKMTFISEAVNKANELKSKITVASTKVATILNKMLVAAKATIAGKFTSAAFADHAELTSDESTFARQHMKLIFNYLSTEHTFADLKAAYASEIAKTLTSVSAAVTSYGILQGLLDKYNARIQKLEEVKMAMDLSSLQNLINNVPAEQAKEPYVTGSISVTIGSDTVTEYSTHLAAIYSNAVATTHTVPTGLTDAEYVRRVSLVQKQIKLINAYNFEVAKANLRGLTPPSEVVKKWGDTLTQGQTFHLSTGNVVVPSINNNFGYLLSKFNNTKSTVNSILSIDATTFFSKPLTQQQSSIAALGVALTTMKADLAKMKLLNAFNAKMNAEVDKYIAEINAITYTSAEVTASGNNVPSAGSSYVLKGKIITLPSKVFSALKNEFNLIRQVPSNEINELKVQISRLKEIVKELDIWNEVIKDANSGSTAVVHVTALSGHSLQNIGSTGLTESSRVDHTISQMAILRGTPGSTDVITHYANNAFITNKEYLRKIRINYAKTHIEWEISGDVVLDSINDLRFAIMYMINNPTDSTFINNFIELWNIPEYFTALSESSKVQFSKSVTKMFAHFAATKDVNDIHFFERIDVSNKWTVIEISHDRLKALIPVKESYQTQAYVQQQVQRLEASNGGFGAGIVTPPTQQPEVISSLVQGDLTTLNQNENFAQIFRAKMGTLDPKSTLSKITSEEALFSLLDLMMGIQLPDDNNVGFVDIINKRSSMLFSDKFTHIGWNQMLIKNGAGFSASIIIEGISEDILNTAIDKEDEAYIKARILKETKATSGDLQSWIQQYFAGTLFYAKQNNPGWYTATNDQKFGWIIAGSNGFLTLKGELDPMLDGITINPPKYLGATKQKITEWFNKQTDTEKARILKLSPIDFITLLNMEKVYDGLALKRYGITALLKPQIPPNLAQVASSVVTLLSSKEVEIIHKDSGTTYVMNILGSGTMTTAITGRPDEWKGN